MITRNFTEEGELIVSGKQFEINQNAVRIKVMRYLRKLQNEDRYDVTNGVDLSVLMRLSSNEAFVSRYLNDYLSENIPEIEQVLFLRFEQDKETNNLKINLLIQTQEGQIEI